MVTPPVSVDRYVLDTLMRDLVRHDRHPSAFLVYLQLWHLAAAGRDFRVQASHAQLALETGLSKSAVQAAVRHLKRRKLVRSEHAHASATPRYEVLRPWHRAPEAGRSVRRSSAPVPLPERAR